MSRRHIPSIDAIRGWAVLGVIITHVATAAPPSPFWVPLADQGARGVQLFFIASAFTLFLSWYERADEPSPTLCYFIRRFFRIAPFYYLALLFWIGYGGANATEAVFVLFFIQSWHPQLISAIIPGGWSITVEANFYLLLPLLVARVRNFREAVWTGGILSILGVLAAVAGYALAPRFWSGHELIVANGYFALYWLPVCLPAFSAGMVLYFAHAEGRFHRWTHPAAMIPVGMALLIISYLPVPLKNVLMVPPLGAFAFILLRQPIPVFVNRLTRCMGRLSYSAYFMHFVVIVVIEAVLPPAARNFMVMALLTIPLTFLASEVTYRLVERPGRRLGRTVIHRLVARDQIVTGASS